jgi:hypothetical protein
MKQADFTELPNLSLYRYENFFNIYQDKDQTKFYNLLRSINIFPAQDSSVEDIYYVEPNDTWINISYKYYNTVYLWWLVCEYNRITNPLEMPELGTKLKLLKSQYVWPIITELNKQINN